MTRAKARRKTHYAGALRWTNKRGDVTVIIAGWAACCSGPRAARIRATGANTYDRKAVTCELCLAAIKAAGI